MDYSDTEIVAAVLRAGGDVEITYSPLPAARAEGARDDLEGSALIMYEWVQTNLYSELIAMPLWTLSAFCDIYSGSKITIRSDDVRYKLIVHLVLKHMGRSDCPYDSDHRHNWKVSEYIPVIKVAVSMCKHAIYRGA